MQSVVLLNLWDFFCNSILWELTFAVVDDSSGFSCWVLIFAIFEKS